MSIDLKSAAVGVVLCLGIQQLYQAKDSNAFPVRPRRSKNPMLPPVESPLRGGNSGNVVPICMKTQIKSLPSIRLHDDDDSDALIERRIMKSKKSKAKKAKKMEHDIQIKTSHCTNDKTFDKNEVIKINNVTNKHKEFSDEFRTRIIDAESEDNCCLRSLFVAIMRPGIKKKSPITAGDVHNLRSDVVKYADTNRGNIKITGSTTINDEWIANMRKPSSCCNDVFLTAATEATHKRILVVDAEGKCLSALGNEKDKFLIILMYDNEHYMSCSYSDKLNDLWKSNKKYESHIQPCKPCKPRNKKSVSWADM